MVFLGKIWKMHGRNDLKFGVLIYHDRLHIWLNFGCSLLNFMVLTAVWLISETDQSWSNWWFPGKIWRMHGRHGLQFGVFMYPHYIQNGLNFGHGLLIFLVFASILLSETGQIGGFQTLSGEVQSMVQQRHFRCSAEAFINAGIQCCLVIRPFEKRDVLCRGNVRPSVRPSAFSGLFFNMLWDINLKLGIYIQ